MSIQREIRLPPVSLLDRPPSEYERDPGTLLTSGGGGAGRCRASTPGVTTLPGVGWASGYLSTWPAHITSQVVQQGRRVRRHTAGGGEIRNHGCGEEFGSPVAKPRFLEQLEGYLKRELHAIDPQLPQVQERRLQAYREVFDCFIADFKTYKPLLTAIKNEYEITLAYLRDQLRELRPLRARLAMVSEACETRILGLRKEERAEIRALKEERLHMLKALENMREKQSALQAQVSSLQGDLAAQYLMYREESDARKLLIANLSSLSYGPEKKSAEEHHEVDSEDPVMVKLALRVCREDLTRAQTELSRLQADYGDVVPRRDWESLEHTHSENLIKLETMQADFEQMRSEYDTLLELHRHTTSDKDSLQVELERFRESSTPRPCWDRCAEMLGGAEHWAALSQDQSSQRKLEILLDELVGKTSEQKDFFTGLGGGAEVPVYLRYDGQLRNLRLKKDDVIRVIREAWKEKVAEDQRRDESGDLGEFLHRHLKGQHGEQAGDWAYSLAEAMRQHPGDDVISLFHLILTGKVDESVYHGQTRLLAQLLKALIQADGSESGALSPQEFREALRTAFPLKEEQDVEALVSTAQQELSVSNTASIHYQRLYNEDADGKHRAFLSLVKDQAERERHQYISQLRAQLGGKGEVTVADLRSAFRSIDPSLDSSALAWYLSTAFQVSGSDLEQQTAPAQTEQLLQRLLVADVTRAGTGPQQD